MRKTFVVACIVMLVLVGLNDVVHAKKPPQDPPPEPTAQQVPWGVDRIDADKVWDTITGAGIKVAILDTGVKRDHPDLVANIKGGINTVGPAVGDKPSADPGNYEDTYGHGTKMAGVVAAINNNEGVIGIGPDIEIYGVRFRETLYVIPQEGGITDLCEGMQWCIDNGMDVIAMSFSVWTVYYDNGEPQKGEPLHDPVFYSLIQQAYNAGIVMVAAVTNDSEWVEELYDPDNPPDDLSTYRFPASYPQVIGVSATGLRTGGKKSDRGDYFTDYSNYGPAVDLAAPAEAVETTIMDGDGYGPFGGTSAACPHVAATAALVLAQFGLQSPDWVRSRLMDTVEWIEAFTPDQQGAGMVDAEAAVLGSFSAPPRCTFSPRGKLSITWGDLKGR